MNRNSKLAFPDAVARFMAGDFSRLAPLFETPAGHLLCPVQKWFEDGLFATAPKALEEAFTCACFNGSVHMVEYWLAKGVNPNGGSNTGLNALHWAANRGQLQVVEILIKNNASLETINAYGGTVLACAVWSAIHEPKPEHIKIIEALLAAGARVDAVQIPSGDERIDATLRRNGASQ